MRDIGKFIAGFRQFQRTYFCADSQYLTELAAGQNPGAMVIACSDSRVDPAILTGCEPGDMFVVRNVANLVPPREQGKGLHGVSAALEYGVKALGVGHLIVLGHSGCGGIQALMSPNPAGLGEFIEPWVRIAEPAAVEVRREMPGKPPEVLQRACEQAAVLVSLENLLSFPWIYERVARRELTLHGWYFDLGRGELLGYLPETGTFEPLVAECEKLA